MSIFKRKEKPKKENVLSGRRAFSNNLYVLKIIQKVAPSFLPTYFLWSVLGSILDFFIYTWMMRKVVNDFQLGEPMEKLAAIIIALLVGQVVFDVFITILRKVVYPRYQQKIVAAIEQSLFEKASKVELECYENPKFYDKYVRAMDNSYSRCMDVVYTVDSLIWRVTSISTNALILVSIDPWLALVALIPLLLGFVRKYRNRLQKTRDDERRPIDRRQAYVQRSFYLGEYAKEMRLTAMPKLMIGYYKEALKDHIALQKKYGFKMAFLKTVGDTGPNLVVFLAGIYAAYCTLISHTMLAGDFLVVFNTVGQVAWVLASLVTTLEEFRSHALYIEDYRYFLDYEPKIKKNANGIPASAGTLSVENVTFRYAGADRDALQNINMTVRQGEKIALVGHNGSGKSTLVKLLLHLYEPTEGAVKLDGISLADYDQDSLKEQFAVVFQDFKLLSLSVAENILLRPLKEGDEERVTEALQKSGGWEKVSTLKNGIHTTLTREFDDEGAVLSGGEGQKVLLARAFACDSPIIILDEPSSALDPIAEYQMFRNMLEACEGRTLIFISHRLASAVLADHVYLLENGRIVEDGSHRALMEQNGRYAELFRKQAENYVKEVSRDEA
ncbi:MAG: ABC transporter ATP-binding protein [Clostridia bacterium]|nr:ABC transporter ATP-binding protein [Clostridia bacterium]MBQ9130828.1 ABC transporter ATP-binding protein [Clostridia bacterium]